MYSRLLYTFCTLSVLLFWTLSLRAMYAIARTSASPTHSPNHSTSSPTFFKLYCQIRFQTGSEDEDEVKTRWMMDNLIKKIYYHTVVSRVDDGNVRLLNTNTDRIRSCSRLDSLTSIAFHFPFWCGTDLLRSQYQACKLSYQADLIRDEARKKKKS